MRKKIRITNYYPGDNALKILRAMKLTFILACVSALQISANVLSQNTVIRLNVSSNSFGEIISAIEEQSEFKIFYKNEQVNLDRRVALDNKMTTVSQILSEALDGTDIGYTLIDKVIVLSPSKEKLIRQQQTITGKVTSSQGNPVIGATVMVKGTTNGTITDADGNYTISVASDNATLVFSYIGMKALEIPVGNSTQINAILEEESVGLDEVVVIGYGTKKKVNLTGSVASVQGEDMNRRPVTNPAAMMQGLMPGVQIVQHSGEPGDERINIRIRGTGTFSSAGSDPLVLVDGVEGKLEDLNPSNIESVSVLKDAASASIYGSRAANGVILVTTKTGKEGKFTVEYSGNYSIASPTKMFDLITNSVQYMEMNNEARINSGQPPDYPQDVIDAYRNAPAGSKEYPNYDWLGDLFSPAPTQTHNLAFSGGSNGTKYNVSLGYVDQEGVMKGFTYQKYNARVNISSEVNDRITFGANIALKKGIKSNPRNGSQDMFLSTMAQAPTYAPQLPDGTGRWTYKAYSYETNNKNSYALIGNDITRNASDYAVYSQGWLNVELMKGLNWYTKAALNLDISTYDDFKPVVPLYNFHTGEYMRNLDVGGSGLIVQDDQNVYKNLYSYLAYDKEIGGSHNINVMVGYSAEDNVSSFLKGYRKDYEIPSLRQIDGGSPAVQTANGSQTEWAIMSFFGRLGYNYKERYLLEANMRYDGTSRMSSASRWGVFPSFSAGWRITEEQFMKNMDITWLDNFKLRGSYGQLGNQRISPTSVDYPYPYQALLELTNNYSYDDASLSSGVAQKALSNENIKWETTTIVDLGLDLTVFRGLSLTVDWYKKTTTDILRKAQVADVVGLSAPFINDGTMENKGIELGIQYTNSVNSGSLSGLNYTAGFNLDHYKNKLVKFGEREIPGYILREEGYEWEAYYMVKQIGIFQTEEEIANAPKQYNDATVPGDLKYLDADGDGDVDNDDRTYIPGKYPKLNYAGNFGVNWKGFDLSGLIQGVSGVKYYVNLWGTVPFIHGAPPTTDWNDRWTETNPSTTQPRMYWSYSTARIWRTCSWYLQDASYIRLKNLTFGYTLPVSLTQHIGIDQLRVYFSGDNLITLTDYPGLDPERAASGNYAIYPQNRIYSFGLNVKF